MSSGTKMKKKVSVLLTAIMMGLSSLAAGSGNKIIGLRFFEANNQVKVVVITEQTYSAPLKAVKSGNYYNIVLNNIVNGTNKEFTPGGRYIKFAKATTLSSSTDGSNYTRISLKVTPGTAISVESRTANTSDIAFLEEQSMQRQAEQERLKEEARLAAEQQRLQEEEQQRLEEEQQRIEEEQRMLEEQRREEEQEYASNMEDTKVSPPERNQEPAPVPETTMPAQPSSQPISTRHTSEILYLLIGTAAVLLVIILLYIKGKDKMQELCGDMNINLDNNKNEKKNNKDKKAQNKSKAQNKPVGLIDLDSSYDYHPQPEIEIPTQQKIQPKSSVTEEPEETVIDLDEIYAGPKTVNIPASVQNSQTENIQPVSTPDINNTVEDEDDDIDDFLSSFADDDEEENAVENTTEEASQTVHEDTKQEPADIQENESQQPETGKSAPKNEQDDNNPIDNLIDDVITTQGLTFTESDIEAITAKLQADLTPELAETAAPEAEPAQSPITKLTVEEFDKKYPQLSDAEINAIINNKNIKFNDIDTNVIFSPITSFEMSEDAILEAQLRKEKVDEENIQYYESEQDFAFTLIKTQDVKNPDELVVLDNNIYPDLDNVDFSNDDIFKEFSFAKPDYAEINTSDEAPSVEDIDNAIAREMEVINRQKEAESNDNDNNNEILSEFKLIKPEIEVPRADENFSTTIFTSMDDIEAQFKALGVEFDSDKQQPAENAAEEETPESNIALKSETHTPIQPVLEEKIYASCNIDFSTELYITSYNDNISLIGMKNGTITHLYDFLSEDIPSKLTVRKTEELENGTRYLVRADKEKFIIDVSDSDITLVMTL